LGADHQGSVIDYFEGFKSSYDDLLNLENNWMKNIAGERPFLPTFFSCKKKVWSFGKEANRKTAWMQVSAAHYEQSEILRSRSDKNLPLSSA
jgi:hypothetical protein